MDKISVILPVYNGENYIKDCIESILIQTVDNFELIITDNNSTDKTHEIINNFSDKRIKFITNKGASGICGNLNNGFQNASGEFIQIICHDDLLEPDCLEKQYNILSNHLDAGMVFCDKHDIDSLGQKINRQTCYSRKYLPPIIDSGRTALYFMCFGCLPGNLSTVMITKKAFAKTGLFDKNLIYVGDFEYWVRLGVNFSMLSNDSKLVSCRDHPKRATRVFNEKLIVIKEESRLWELLIHQNKTTINKDKLIHYFTYRRGTQYINWILKAFLAGKFSIAMKGFSEIRAPFSKYQLLQAFIFSLNGKINQPMPNFLNIEPVSTIDMAK